MKFSEFIENVWRKSCYERYKPSTQKRTKSILDMQLMPRFGDLELDGIDAPKIKKWFDGYTAVAPAGANRALDALKQMLSYAEEMGYSSGNPARSIEPNERKKRRRFLSRPEMRRLGKVLDRHRGRGSGAQQTAIIKLLLLSGCRKSEIVKLRWSEYDGAQLNLTDSKTGPRKVLLSGEARAVLEGVGKVRGSPWVFPDLADPGRHRTLELSLWRSAVKDAQLEDVRLHDLRHTFASYAAMLQVPLPVLARILGHSHPRMTMRYAHAADRGVMRAAEKVGAAVDARLDAWRDDPRRHCGPGSPATQAEDGGEDL